jgi:hypothetical protein
LMTVKVPGQSKPQNLHDLGRRGRASQMVLRFGICSEVQVPIGD